MGNKKQKKVTLERIEKAHVRLERMFNKCRDENLGFIRTILLNGFYPIKYGTEDVSTEELKRIQ